MDKRECMSLRVLINRFNPKAGNRLLNFLHEEDKQAVRDIEIDSTLLTPLLEQPQNGVAKIHYSWIEPLISHFPSSLQPAVLSSLTSEQKEGLDAQPSLPLPHFVRIFYLNQIYALLKIDEHFPLEYLPTTPLSSLLQWKKQELMHLADFLGLYDLAAEMRHIVNRDQLKNIYSCLTPKQFHYLKICLHQKEKIISPKLGLDFSQSNCAKLKQVVHKRGLIRLGKALCGEHRDFVWHLAHILDKGRGNLLLKEYRESPFEKVTPILKQQVMHLMNYLKSE